jgi:hypothetical protein
MDYIQPQSGTVMSSVDGAYNAGIAWCSMIDNSQWVAGVRKPCRLLVSSKTEQHIVYIYSM